MQHFLATEKITCNSKFKHYVTLPRFIRRLDWNWNHDLKDACPNNSFINLNKKKRWILDLRLIFIELSPPFISKGQSLVNLRFLTLHFIRTQVSSRILEELKTSLRTFKHLEGLAIILGQLCERQRQNPELGPFLQELRYLPQLKQRLVGQCNSFRRGFLWTAKSQKSSDFKITFSKVDTSMEILKSSFTPFSNTSQSLLHQILQRNGPFLRSLEITPEMQEGGREDCDQGTKFQFTRHLASPYSWKNLSCLDFTWSPMSQNEVADLFALISGLKKLEQLTLRLVKCNFNAEPNSSYACPLPAIRKFGLSVEQKEWLMNNIIWEALAGFTHLEELQFDLKCLSQYDPFVSVLPMVERQKQTLRVFVFNAHFNLVVTRTSIDQLHGILKDLKRIKTLKIQLLDKIKILRSDLRLEDIIISLPSLYELAFASPMAFQNQDLSLCFSALSSNMKNLRFLTLNQPNAIPPLPSDFLLVISEYLRGNSCLEKLKLKFEILNVDFKEIKRLQKALPETLQTLSLQYLSLRNASPKDIYQQLLNKTSLKRISLGFHGSLTDEDTRILRNIFKNPKLLLKLKFHKI